MAQHLNQLMAKHAKIKTDCCAAGHACAGISHNTIPAAVRAVEGAETAQYRIQNMDCPTEERLIRNKLEGMPGIVGLDFNLMSRVLHVHHRLEGQERVAAALKAIGMHAELVGADQNDAPAIHGAAGLSATQKLLLAISGSAAAAAEMLAWTTGTDASPLVICCALLSILTGGLPTLRKGWTALKNFTINIYFLMSLAVIGAVAIGQWPEAAMVIFLFAVAELIESLSLTRARNAVHGLLKLAPDTVTVRAPNGAWHEAPVRSVAVGSVIRVKPGDRIALDGIVLNGESAVNQAPITGESMPVNKRQGDTVYAGSINQRGALEIQVSTHSGNSTLAKIVRVIEETQSKRAPTQRFVDQFARYYTPVIVILAVLVALVPSLAFGAPFEPWLYKALVLLVIACPCALVISTPVTIVSGLTAAARRGILIKGGQYLEAGHRLKAIALDKTGTLTVGRPVVAGVEPIAAMPAQEILRLAASLEVHSEHPVAQAVVKAGPEAAALQPISGFEALLGRGVKAEINGTTHYLGNQRLMEELGVCSPQVEAGLRGIESKAQTAIALATREGALGIIAVADAPRAEAREAVRRLDALNVRTVMLTGDNALTAQQIGKDVGIASIKAELLPEDKLEQIRQLQSQYGAVGMLGDGINDAPALAQAQVGFAMGAAGSDTAIETADVALMNDDLRKLPEFIELSRSTRRILIQNIGAALAIKAVFFGLALAGAATLWMAVFADVGASVLVVLNGLRLLRHAEK
jgi:Cd2+/Zn2+-exporting ATPase